MAEEDIQFQDADSTSNYNNDKVTFRDICLQHMRKITQLSCCEFRGGYWETTEMPASIGGMQTTILNRKYVEDSRAVYCNAVDCFADMLFPYYDKKMTESENESISQLNKLEKPEEKKEICTLEAQNGDEYTEEEEEIKPIQKNSSFRDERVKINRKLFRALCSFLHRKNYLELGTIHD